MAVVSLTADRSELPKPPLRHSTKSGMRFSESDATDASPFKKNDEATRAELMGLNQTIISGDIVCPRLRPSNIGYKVSVDLYLTSRRQ